MRALPASSAERGACGRRSGYGRRGADDVSADDASWASGSARGARIAGAGVSAALLVRLGLGLGLGLGSELGLGLDKRHNLRLGLGLGLGFRNRHQKDAFTSQG